MSQKISENVYVGDAYRVVLALDSNHVIPIICCTLSVVTYDEKMHKINNIGCQTQYLRWSIKFI